MRYAAQCTPPTFLTTDTSCAAFCTTQVKRALEWLQRNERYEARRLAAVLVLRQLADHAPTLFYQHVNSFFSWCVPSAWMCCRCRCGCPHIVPLPPAASVWIALCDSKYEVRESAAKALCSCLSLVRLRQSRCVAASGNSATCFPACASLPAPPTVRTPLSRHRTKWYHSIYKLAKSEVGKGATSETIHGCLLTFGELLHDTDRFMEPYFMEVCCGVPANPPTLLVGHMLTLMMGFVPQCQVCNTVLTYRSSKDRLVRRTVIALLPRLASFKPDVFACNVLNKSIEYLLRLVCGVTASPRPPAWLPYTRLTPSPICSLRCAIAPVPCLIPTSAPPRSWL